MSETINQSIDNGVKVNVIGATKIASELKGKISVLLSDSNLILDPFVSSILDGYLDRVFIRSFVLDSLCKPSNSLQETVKKWKDKVALVIYMPIQDLFYANETYVRATGLSSLKEIQTKSRDKTLYPEIYEGENLDTTLDKTSRLENGEIKDYIDTPIAMKSGERFKWYTRKKSLIISNGLSQDISVRVGVNIGENEEGISLENGSRKPLSTFDFWTALDMVDKNVKSIFNSNPHISSELKKGIEDDMARLKIFAQIGDDAIDFGPLPVYFNYKQETFLNNMFLRMSGYDKSSSMNMLMDLNSPAKIGRQFGDKLFGSEKNEILRQTIDNLQEKTGMCGTVHITRKNQDTVKLILNVNKLTSEGDQLWMGVITSPISPIFEEDDLLDDKDNTSDSTQYINTENFFND